MTDLEPLIADLLPRLTAVADPSEAHAILELALTRVQEDARCGLLEAMNDPRSIGLACVQAGYVTLKFESSRVIDHLSVICSQTTT